MKRFLEKLLSEDSSVSMTRFLSLICVVVACIIVLYGIRAGSDLSSLSGICSTFLGFGFGAKVIQKSMEGKK